MTPGPYGLQPLSTRHQAPARQFFATIRKHEPNPYTSQTRGAPKRRDGESPGLSPWKRPAKRKDLQARAIVAPTPAIDLSSRSERLGAPSKMGQASEGPACSVFDKHGMSEAAPEFRVHHRLPHQLPSNQPPPAPSAFSQTAGFPEPTRSTCGTNSGHRKRSLSSPSRRSDFGKPF